MNLKDEVRQVREGDMRGRIVGIKDVDYPFGKYRIYRVRDSLGLECWINEKYLVKV